MANVLSLLKDSNPSHPHFSDISHFVRYKVDVLGHDPERSRRVRSQASAHTILGFFKERYNLYKRP